MASETMRPRDEAEFKAGMRAAIAGAGQVDADDLGAVVDAAHAYVVAALGPPF